MTPAVQAELRVFYDSESMHFIFRTSNSFTLRQYITYFRMENAFLFLYFQIILKSYNDSRYIYQRIINIKFVSWNA